MAQKLLVCEKFKANEVVPDVLAECADDVGLATLDFGDAKVEVANAKFTPTATKACPKTSWNGDANGLHTVIFTDPDAVSRKEPLYREFVHGVFCNIKGTTFGEQCDEVMSYCGPAPPCKSGFHRYACLVYSQTKPVSEEEQKSGAETFAGRGGKKTNAWATSLGMKLVAGNVWESEWEEYVDEVHKMLGFVPPPKYHSPSQKKAAAAN